MITARMLLPTLICSSLSCGYFLWSAMMYNDDTVSVEVPYTMPEGGSDIIRIPSNVPEDIVRRPRPGSREEIRMVRYTTQAAPIKYWSHDGKSVMEPQKLKSTIHAVLCRLPQVEATKNMEKALFEIAYAETDGGLWNRKWRSKGDFGVFQIRHTTVKDTLEWLKAAHPDVHEVVMSFYDKRCTMEKNMDYNVAFGAALCATYLWRACPEADLSTVRSRAKVWKKWYNTHLGKGTVQHYMNRNKKDA